MRRARHHKFRRVHLLAGVLIFSLLFFVYGPRDSAANSYYYKKGDNGVVYYTNIDPKSDSYKRITNPWGTFRGTPRSQRGYLNSYKYSDKFDQHINSTARWYGIDPLLIKAMIKVESNFNPDAVSPKGAMGIMQLMPATAERVGVADPFNPVENIEGGVKYFNKLMNMFSDVTLAIAGYNSGENAVIKYGNKIPPYSETIEYVEKVYLHYDHLRNSHPNRDIKSLVAEKKNMAKPASAGEKKRSFIYVETLGDESVVHSQAAKVRAQVKDAPVPKTVPEKTQQIAEEAKVDSASGSESLVMSDSEGRYTVQLASFPDIQDAREMEQALKSRTYPAYIEKADLAEKGTWYRVKVGKFATREEASEYGNDIKILEPDVKSILVTLN